MKKILNILQATWLVASLAMGVHMADIYIQSVREAFDLPSEQIELDK